MTIDAAAFDRFIGIDWSGAKGARQPGLALAQADRVGVVTSIPAPEHKAWGRRPAADFITGLAGRGRSLIGIDSSFALPFLDVGAYLPGGGPDMPSVRRLWAEVDACCQNDEHFYGGGFVARYSDWFHRPGAKGCHAAPRLRQCETRYNERWPGRSETSFRLIGASQVGLSALSTMRLLHRLSALPYVAVWPFDDITNAEIVLVECFATLFPACAGHRGKLRAVDQLQAVLGHYRSRWAGEPAISDHMGDAAAMAAGIRAFAGEQHYWQPGPLSSMVRRTEGWIFGLD